MKPLSRVFPLAVPIFLLALACGTPEVGIPTWTVEPTAFEHRITAEGQLKAAISTQVGVPPQVQRRVRLAWLIEDGLRVAEGDLIARFDPQEMKDRLEAGQADLRSAELRAQKVELQNQARLTDLEADHDVAALEVDHAQRFRKSDVGVFSRQEIMEELIDEELAIKRQENASGAQTTQKALGRAEVEIQQIEQRKAQLQIDQAQEGLEALEVRAPHAGVITIERDWNGNPLQVGTDLWRGRTVAQIPDLSKLEAEVYVLEADAGGLAVGQKAEVIVEAHPETVYSATIKQVDASAQPRFRGSPVQYFGVVLELETDDFTVIKPGQRVRASLELAKIEDAFVVPRQAIFQDITSEEAARPSVFRKSGSGFSAQAVELGVAGRGLVVIESGLTAGDEVALHRPPTTSEIETDGSITTRPVTSDPGTSRPVASTAAEEGDANGDS